MQGVFSRQHWLLLFLAAFVPAFWGGAWASLLQAQPPLPAETPEQTPPEPAVAQPEPVEQPSQEPAENVSGFERIQAYQAKIQRLKDFQRERGLEQSGFQRRSNQAADEVQRLVGGLELLMEQEAQQIYEQAMQSEPAERDRLLTRLKNIPYPELQVRRRAEEELNQRTAGEELYPSVEEAREAQRKLDEEERKSQEDLEKKDLEDLENLKQDLLSDPISEAARTFAEQEARQRLESALRLVLPQRRDRLQEIARRYPGTEAAHEAGEILAFLEQHNELVANQKLQKALRTPLVYDQRWRRLKELEREHPGTPAAAQAQEIFNRHLALVPPVIISNHTADAVEFTVDKPCSIMEQVRLPAGESRTFLTAFPMMIRVPIRDGEWEIYRVWPGGNFVLEAPQGVPVLCEVPLR